MHTSSIAKMHIKNYVTFVVLILFINGCACYQEAPLSNLQIGHSGRKCSFETSLFIGSFTAQGRNEGFLKSIDEIYTFIPFFAIPQKYCFAKKIASGMTLYEYRSKDLRHAANQNLYADVLTTISYCNSRSNVPNKHITKSLLCLFRNNFLNTDVIIAAFDNGVVDKTEARKQVWAWIQKTYDNYSLNYYILDGNKNMLRKLYERKLINKEEAAYLLKRWFLKFNRMECSMIEDIEYFEIVNSNEVDMLLKREAAHLPLFAEFDKKKDHWEDQVQIIKNRVANNLIRPQSIPEDIL